MNKKITLILFLLVLSTTVFAQSNLEAAQQTNLLDLIKTGGWAMWPLGAFSVFMVTLIIQNYISLRAKKLLHVDQMPKLLDLMINRKVTSALIYCKENPSLFSNTYSAGLEKYLDDNEIDFQKVKSAVEEASVEQTAKLMKPIDYLSIIGATSPMLGLLGTVSGMIKAFKTMGTSGMGKPELLAANIGEALITTATGLIIAIPAMFFFFYFKKSFQKSLATIGRNIGFLFDALQSGKKPTSFLNLEDLKKLEQK